MKSKKIFKLQIPYVLEDSILGEYKITHPVQSYLCLSLCFTEEGNLLIDHSKAMDSVNKSPLISDLLMTFAGSWNELRKETNWLNLENMPDYARVCVAGYSINSVFA